MLVCSACSKANPADVTFCIGCGVRLVLPVSSAAPVSPGAAAASAARRSMSVAASPGSVYLPAYRPFGVVFLMVVGLFTGFALLLIGPLLLYGSRLLYGFGGSLLGGMTMDYAGVGRGTPMLGILLGVLLFAGGLISITGAIGLWILAQWGRQAITGVQCLGILVGLALLGTSANNAVHESGLSGMIALLGVVVIAYSVTVMLYLTRGQMDSWFRSA